MNPSIHGQMIFDKGANTMQKGQSFPQMLETIAIHMHKSEIGL